MAACCNFRQFRVVKDDLKLFCDVYIMLCHVSDPNLGLIVFILNEQLTEVNHETSTVSRSDNIFVSVGIGMKGSSRNRVNAAMSPVSIVDGCSRRQKIVYHLPKSGQNN